MKNTLLNIYEKEGTKKVLASLLSIFIGLTVGAIVVAIIGMTKDTITTNGIEGIPEFWEKGCRYFKIASPTGEQVEFCQVL